MYIRVSVEFPLGPLVGANGITRNMTDRRLNMSLQQSESFNSAWFSLIIPSKSAIPTTFVFSRRFDECSSPRKLINSMQSGILKANKFLTCFCNTHNCYLRTTAGHLTKGILLLDVNSG